MTASPHETVMTITHPDPVHIHGYETLRTASERMAATEIGALIVRRGTHAVGIITERDIVMAVGDDADVDETRVQEVMSEHLAGIEHTAPIPAAIERMADCGIRHLVVRAEGRIVGIVSARDVLQVMGSVTAGR